MSYTLPINNKVDRPSTSIQYENGKIPLSAMVQVPNVGSKCLMDRTAARAFEACFDLAIKMIGVKIKDVGDYRSFEDQVALFVDKGPSTPGRYIPVSKPVYDSSPSAHRKVWSKAIENGYQSIYWVKHFAKFGYWPATAASPGSSNHGYALALDVAEENDQDTSPDPITEVFVGWLCLNAPKFGIYASLASEKWHWQYVRGDDIPQAVLDYENSNDPGEEDMDLIPREQRLFDSRPQTAYTGSPLAKNQVLELSVPDFNGAKAAIVNITATQTQAAGWLSKKLPTSCLNWSGSFENICNEVTVFLSPDGEFVIINGPSPTHIVVDLVGLWVPTS